MGLWKKKPFRKLFLQDFLFYFFFLEREKKKGFLFCARVGVGVLCKSETLQMSQMFLPKSNIVTNI